MLMSSMYDEAWKKSCENTIIRAREKANECYNTFYAANRIEAERIEHSWVDVQLTDGTIFRIGLCQLAFVVVKVTNAVRSRAGNGEGLKKSHNIPLAKTVQPGHEGGTNTHER